MELPTPLCRRLVPDPVLCVEVYLVFVYLVSLWLRHQLLFLPHQGSDVTRPKSQSATHAASTVSSLSLPVSKLTTHPAPMPLPADDEATEKQIFRAVSGCVRLPVMSQGSATRCT